MGPRSFVQTILRSVYTHDLGPLQTSYSVNKYSPIFKSARVVKIYSMDIKHNSLHLARKYARIFDRGHYLFREANSFPRA